MKEIEIILIKKNFEQLTKLTKRNIPYFVVMFITFVLLITRYSSSLDDIIKILLTWAFAISTHKIFIDDIAYSIKEDKKDMADTKG